MTGTTTGPFGGEYTPDPLAQFLSRVVPWSPSSYLNIHAFGGTGRLPYKGGGRAFQGLDELGLIQSHVDYLNRIEAEAFFCLSAQTEYLRIDDRGRNRVARRSRENVHQIKALVVDLDVKPKGYASQRAALAAVLPFLEGLGLKPGFIVSSGRGLHVYIVLADAVPPVEWQGLADALIEACAAHGIHHDVSVTRNPATLLRLPSSTNRKEPSNPLVCKVLAAGPDMTAEAVAAALRAYPPRQATPQANGHAPLDLSHLPRRSPITGPEADRVRSEVERARVVTSMELLRTACPVVEVSYQRGGDGDQEPLWFELAKLCHYVTDGRDWFHHLSCDDDRYDFEQANRKYDSHSPRGWPACATIAAASPAAEAICRECPMYKQGHSPIHAALGIVSKPQPYVNGVNGHASHEAFISTAPEIELPPGYQFNEQRLIVDDKGKAIIKTPVIAIELRKRYEALSGSHATVLQMTVPMGDSENRATTFDFPVEATGSAERTHSLLAKHGCIVSSGKEASKCLMDFTSWIQNNRKAHVENRLGWTFTDGTLDGFSYQSSDPEMVPRGTLAEWKSAANTLVGRGCTAIEMIIAGSFAAPLIVFTSVDGAVLFAKSTGSGTGKTAALETGASVWMSANGVITSGTEMGLAERVSSFNNLPVYHDEMVKTATAKQRFADLIMQITSGRERLRLGMHARPNKRRSSNTMLIAASNYSLVEAASGGESNAQAVRVLEINMDDSIKNLGLSLSDVAHIKRKLEANYGTAGKVYADWLDKNHDKARQAMVAAVDYFQAAINGTDGDRFWIAIAASLLVGAKLAKQLGLLDFDVSAIHRQLVIEVQGQRANVTDMGLDPDDPSHVLRVLNAFLNEDLSGIIHSTGWPEVVNRHTKIEDIKVNRPDLAERTRQFIARRIKNPPILIVSETAWKRSCLRRERPYNYSAMRHTLISGKHCVRADRTLTAGTNLPNRAMQERVLLFDLTLPQNAVLTEEGTNG